jgi:orotidine-5'-phosphate decarboxylase
MSETSIISSKPIPGRERLICALDVPSADDARRMVELLGESCVFYNCSCPAGISS